MKKKFIAVVVALALVVGAVGIGVHVMNREAQAVLTYSVLLLENEWGGNEGPVPVGPYSGATVEMRFLVDLQWTDWIPASEYTSGGRYYVNRPVASTTWMVRITEPNIDPLQPGENPCTRTGTLTSFEWDFIVE